MSQMSPVSLMMLIVIVTVCVIAVIITISVCVGALFGNTNPRNNQVFDSEDKQDA